MVFKPPSIGAPDGRFEEDVTTFGKVYHGTEEDEGDDDEEYEDQEGVYACDDGLCVHA